MSGNVSVVALGGILQNILKWVELTARLSHIPLDIFASMLAEQGHTRTMSAHRLS